MAFFLPDIGTGMVQGSELARQANWDDIHQANRARQGFVATNIAEATQDPTIAANIANLRYTEGTAGRAENLARLGYAGEQAATMQESAVKQAAFRTATDMGLPEAQARAQGEKAWVEYAKQSGQAQGEMPTAFQTGMAVGQAQPALTGLALQKQIGTLAGDAAATSASRAALMDPAALNQAVASGDPVALESFLNQQGVLPYGSKVVRDPNSGEMFVGTSDPVSGQPVYESAIRYLGRQRQQGLMAMQAAAMQRSRAYGTGAAASGMVTGGALGLTSNPLTGGAMAANPFAPAPAAGAPATTGTPGIMSGQRQQPGALFITSDQQTLAPAWSGGWMPPGPVLVPEGGGVQGPFPQPGGYMRYGAAARYPETMPQQPQYVQSLPPGVQLTGGDVGAAQRVPTAGAQVTQQSPVAAAAQRTPSAPAQPAAPRDEIARIVSAMQSPDTAPTAVAGMQPQLAEAYRQAATEEWQALPPERRTQGVLQQLLAQAQQSAAQETTAAQVAVGRRYADSVVPPGAQVPLDLEALSNIMRGMGGWEVMRVARPDLAQRLLAESAAQQAMYGGM